MRVFFAPLHFYASLRETSLKPTFAQAPPLSLLCTVSRFYSYLNTAVAILSDYRGEVPFSISLKKFFAENKKHGSRDRKEIAALCYAYFRTARLFENDTMEEKILKGIFLCSTGPNELLQQLRPDWNEKINADVEEKCSMINPDSYRDQCTTLKLFPWQDELSEGIDVVVFSESFLVQPDLFLRLRPGKEETAKKKLQEAGISFTELSNSCLALPNASKIDGILRLDQEAVIQDLSSQKTGELLQLLKPPASVWDCCAASGGKSIMAKDILGDIDLTVSDVRESILHNLKKRFAIAGIKNYKSFVANLALSKSRLPAPDSRLPTPNYDLIIADVPCSGSGTWARTPEQLFHFKKEKIEEYAALQKKILSNIVDSLKPGGHLLYITCSVFKKENEEAVEFLRRQYQFQTVKTEVIKGYDQKADTMFAALLLKPCV